MAEDSTPAVLLNHRYQLRAWVGEGGYGTVWRAWDLAEQRWVAVKLLKPLRCRERPSRRRFARECAILRRLRHPNLVRWVDARPAARPRPYVVMNWVSGVSLQALLVRVAQRNKRVAASRALAWARGLARGLAHAHREGVAHRDVKPSNILWEPAHRRVVLVDFGAAQWVRGWGPKSPEHGVIGSKAYLSPEQIEGQAVTGACDQFALATVLFEILTLRRTWLRTVTGELASVVKSGASAQSPQQVMNRIRRGPRPRLRGLRPDLPAAVDAVFERAWEPCASARFPSVLAWLEAFESCFDPQDDSEAPTRVVFTSASSPSTPRAPRVWARTSAVCLAGALAAFSACGVRRSIPYGGFAGSSARASGHGAGPALCRPAPAATLASCSEPSR